MSVCMHCGITDGHLRGCPNGVAIDDDIVVVSQGNGEPVVHRMHTDALDRTECLRDCTDMRVVRARHVLDLRRCRTCWPTGEPVPMQCETCGTPATRLDGVVRNTNDHAVLALCAAKTPPGAHGPWVARKDST